MASRLDWRAGYILSYCFDAQEYLRCSQCLGQEPFTTEDTEENEEELLAVNDTSVASHE